MNMSLATIINELWRFFKDNIVRILIGALVISVITVGARYFITDILLSDRQEAADYLEDVYTQEPSSFKAVVTIEDGQIFSNPHLFDDYFTSPQVVEAVEETTGIEFQETIDSEKKLELFKTPTFRGSISAVRDNASGVFIFRVLAGKTAEENLAIANAYRDLLASGEIPFMDNQFADITLEPVIGEVLDTEEYLSLPTVETLSVYRSNNARSLIVYGVLGFVVGLILTSGIVFLQRLRKSKINYAFEYAWDLDDQHILVHSSHEGAVYNVQDAIRIPAVNLRWIVSQSALSEDFEDTNDSSERFISKLQEVKSDEQAPKQIVIVIQANHTEKRWLKDQMTMATLYNVPLKLVHVY